MAIIYSTGFQQSITNDGSNSKPVINEIEWDTNYKNNKGTMKVNINKKGLIFSLLNPSRGISFRINKTYHKSLRIYRKVTLASTFNSKVH